MPWSNVAILGTAIPPLKRNPYNGYINPYYWVDDHPLLYGNNGSLDPGTHVIFTPSPQNNWLATGIYKELTDCRPSVCKVEENMEIPYFMAGQPTPP